MDIKIMYNESSKILARVLKSKFKQEGFNIVDSHADCVCIIGGDGTFLRALRKLNYDSIPVYIGINSGNLGYLQDVHIDKVGDMINYLKSKEEIKANKVELADITYVYSNNKQKDCAVNEIQISGKHYHKIKFELSDCNGFKEEVVSSGIVFATPFGSTAYNKSLGGPVICEGIDALCATLFAPIQNSKTRDYIQNSIVGKKFEIKVLSDINDVEVIIDGQNVDLDFENLSKIQITIGTKEIFKLNYNNKTYGENMLEKMLKGNL